jgi:pilus assembly protein CpaB
MKNRRRIIGVLAALILATTGTVALVGYVQSARNDAVAQEALVDVYVVDELVPAGAGAEAISESVSLEQVPARLKQPGAVTDLGDIGSDVAAADLQPGDQLVKARLVRQDRVAEELEGKVQIATPVLGPERAVGGALEKGDLVGVYLSFEDFTYEDAGKSTDAAGTATPAPADAAATDTDTTKKVPNMTRLELQHVLVTNVQTTDSPVVTDGEDEVQQVSGSNYVVTLALTPEQSERFVFAAEYGHVWLSNQPAEVSDDGTRLITLGNVYSVAN